MSDDDDYFTDDIFFDDQTLAILDREEKKFLSQATVKTIPPTKRQKTDSGWKAGIGASANEPDFLPEISLNLGGSYGILRGTSHSTTGAAHKPPPSTTNAPSRAHHGQILAPFPKPPLAPRAVQHVSRNPPTRTFQNSRPPTGSPNDGQRSISRTEPAHTALDVWPVSIAHSPSNLPSRSEFLHADQKPGLEARLQELQQKLEQICEENKTIQVALNEAMNAKLAKEGEVTILRKNAEKVSQEHAAQLAKLKAAREEAELKQARMQKDLREETERLKTQLVFKQHEQESIHRPPPSVRPKKFLKDASFIANSTPSRLRHPHQQDEPLGRQVAQKGFVSQTQPLKTPQIKRSSMLPGFENAFSDAAPLHPSKNSDKRRRIQSPDPVSPSKQRRMFTAGADVSMEISAEETFMESAHIDLDGDIDMPFGTSVEDGRFPKVEEQDEDMDETTHTMEPPEWKVELNRIVLMHLLPISHTLTMQLLLGAQIPPDLEDGQSDAYTTACSRCLEVIANAFHCEQDWRHSVDCLSNSLSSMVPLLRTARAVLPLAALLNLLAVLVYSLPDFGSSILSRPSDGTNDSQILIHISAIILDQREIEKQDSHEALATEVVTLLEALSFTVDPELVGKLNYVLQDRQILMNLFRANQPSWLLARSARLLVILASHRQLCRFLLAMPDSNVPIEEKTADPQKIPLIERLCLYLTDAGRKNFEYKEAKTSILTFFALLSNSQPDVHVHLLTSTTVIPSLVLFLGQLTTSFWEDDEDLLSASSEEVSAAIQVLNQALFLLHHLVFTSVSFINLRQKLHAPYHRIFSGLMHIFIVTFGRLSYGEAPEWIDRQGRIDLVSSTDMARDILDHVVDGPEADRTWQAFQLEGERDNETDEEEMEEQLLGEHM